MQKSDCLILSSPDIYYQGIGTVPYTLEDRPAQTKSVVLAHIDVMCMASCRALGINQAAQTILGDTLGQHVTV